MQLGSAAMPVTIKGMAGWQHTYGDVSPVDSVAFAGSAPFSVVGVPIARDALVVEAGLDLNITDRASFALAYNGRYADSSTDQGVRGTLRIRF